MLNVILIGKRSFLSSKLNEKISDKFNVICISIKEKESAIIKRFNSINSDFPTRIIDFSVISSWRELQQYNKVFPHLDNIEGYTFISTKIPKSKPHFLLSAYRKNKLKHELYLSNIFKEKCEVIRLPNVLDSPTWSRMKTERGFELFSFFSKEKKVEGVDYSSVIGMLCRRLHLKDVKLNENYGAGLQTITTSVHIINLFQISKKLYLKSIVLYFLSRSSLFFDLIYKEKLFDNSQRSPVDNNSKDIFSGGFLD